MHRREWTPVLPPRVSEREVPRHGPLLLPLPSPAVQRHCLEQREVVGSLEVPRARRRFIVQFAKLSFSNECVQARKCCRLASRYEYPASFRPLSGIGVGGIGKSRAGIPWPRSSDPLNSHPRGFRAFGRKRVFLDQLGSWSGIMTGQSFGTGPLFTETRGLGGRRPISSRQCPGNEKAIFERDGVVGKST